MDEKTVKCPNCGMPIGNKAHFCGYCGKAVVKPGENPGLAGSSSSAPPANRVPIPNQVGVVEPPIGTGQNNKSRLKWVGLGGIAILSLCICLAAASAGIYFFAPDWLNLDVAGIETIDNSEYPTATGKTLETLPLAPGSVISDSRGAIIAMPALPQPEGYQTALVVSEPGGQLGRALKKIYGDDIVLYSLAPGSVDGAGSMDLVIPAASVDSRLAVLVDGAGLIILPDAPVDGKLTAHLRAYGGTGPGEPNLYTIVPAGADVSREANPSGKLAVPEAIELPQTAVTGVNCSGSWSYNDCRKDQNSIVFLSYKKSDAPAAIQPTLDTNLDTFITSVIDIFAKYHDSGNKFVHANISSSRTVTIKISSSYAEPQYSPKTGNIYLGWGIVQNITSRAEYCTLAHEIMHWIQDEQYPMNINAMFGDETWWLEMTAMYGAYFYNTACLDATIETYGAQIVSDKRRAYQVEPFKWGSNETARYLQGIQFYLGVCSGTGCAISEADLITAINAGSYPYDSSKQSAYNLLAKDTGLYMLGEPPSQGNTTAPILSVYQGPDKYLEEMLYKPDKPAEPFIFPATTGNQFIQVSPMKATVSAKIDLGGEYPLYIGNGDTAMNAPGLPGMLRVAPGTQFWVKTDTQKAIFYNGKTEALIGPIGKLGSNRMRMVAVAPTAATTFNLTYEVADLSGDWSAAHKNATLLNSDCKDPVDLSKVNEYLAEDQFMQYISGFGTYVIDPAKPDGSHYIWQGTSPMAEVAITSDVTVSADKVVLKYTIHIPKPTSSTLPLWSVGLVGSAGLMSTRKQKRLNLILVLLILLPLILTGCEGFALYGDITGEYTFTKITFVDPKTNPGTTTPWILEGKAMIDEALSINIKSEPCHTVTQSDVIVRIGPEGSVLPPSPETETDD